MNSVSKLPLRLRLDLEAITVLCRVYFLQYDKGEEKEENQAKARAAEAADAAAAEFAP
jgi:hypothetical protein